jgi:DNA-directed RNA polymerase specialized sigma24 family protein
MDMNVYFKKIYTVAFRLTGNEKTAYELTSEAILELSGKTDINDKITDCIFKSTALEVCSLFLKKYATCSDELDFDNNSKDKTYEIQKTLLSLNPVSRIIIVWKDFLNFQLSDLTQIINKDKTELNYELSRARMHIKNSMFRDSLLIK